MNASTLQTNLAIQVITFAASIMTARILGPEGRGELALVLLYPQLVANIASLGVDRAVAVRGGRGELARPLAAIVKLALLLSLPAMLAGYVTIRLRVVDQQLAALATAYLVAVPAMHFFLFAVSLVNGKGDFTRYNRMRFGFYVINVLLIAAIWLGVSHGIPKLEAVLLANLAAVYGGFFLGLWQVRGSGNGATAGEHAPTKVGDVKAILSLAVLFAVPMSLLQFSLSAYQIAVEHWLDIKALGFFVVIVGYGRLLHPIGSAIGAHVFHLGISDSKGDIARIFRLSMVAYFFCIVPLWLVGPTLIPLIFGRAFIVDHGIVGILLLSTFHALLADSLGEYLNGRQKVGADIIGRLLYLFVLFSLGSLLSGFMNIFGIAVAMAVGDVIRCLYLIRRVSVLTSHPYSDFLRLNWQEPIELARQSWRATTAAHSGK